MTGSRWMVVASPSPSVTESSWPGQRSGGQTGSLYPIDWSLLMGEPFGFAIRVIPYPHSGRGNCNKFLRLLFLLLYLGFPCNIFLPYPYIPTTIFPHCQYRLPNCKAQYRLILQLDRLRWDMSVWLHGLATKCIALLDFSLSKIRLSFFYHSFYNFVIRSCGNNYFTRFPNKRVLFAGNTLFKDWFGFVQSFKNVFGPNTSLNSSFY